MTKNALIFIYLFLFFTSGCSYKPVYKKNQTLVANKINIFVKSKDYDKKIPNLMKIFLNEKINIKKSRPSNLKLVVSLHRSVSNLGTNKDLYSSGRMISYQVKYAFYDKKGLLTSGKLNNKSTFFVGLNPYANIISEESASENLLISISESLSNIILASKFNRSITP